MSLDLFQCMRAFQLTAEHESFSEAGRRLGVPTSTISRNISALEGHLGATLFYRTTRRVSLAQAGEVYLSHCAPILAQVEVAEEATLTTQIIPRGLLRLSANIAFGEVTIAPMLPDFLRLYPEVQVDLDLSDRLVDLAGEGLDLAIRVGKDSTPMSVTCRELVSNRFVLCASPGYLESSGVPFSMADLAEHRCLSYKFSQRPFWYLTAAASAEPILLDSAVSTNSGRALHGLALQGAGIACLPLWGVMDDLQFGSLSCVLPEYNVSPFPNKAESVYAMYSGDNPPAKVEVFLLALVEHLRTTLPQLIPRSKS